MCGYVSNVYGLHRDLILWKSILNTTANRFLDCLETCIKQSKYRSSKRVFLIKIIYLFIFSCLQDRRVSFPRWPQTCHATKDELRFPPLGLLLYATTLFIWVLAVEPRTSYMISTLNNWPTFPGPNTFLTHLYTFIEDSVASGYHDKVR